MSKSNAYENDVQLFTFHGVTPTGIGGTLYGALHTADPGEGGDQETSEAAYGAYARVGVVRTASGWTVAGSQTQNAAEVLFPTCTSGSETDTHFSLGVNASGASKILYKGVLSSAIAVSVNIAPRFAVSSITVLED